MNQALFDLNEMAIAPRRQPDRLDDHWLVKEKASTARALRRKAYDTMLEWIEDRRHWRRLRLVLIGAACAAPGLVTLGLVLWSALK